VERELWFHKADVRDWQQRVNSTSWTGGPDNVAPMAGLERDVRQQAATSGHCVNQIDHNKADGRDRRSPNSINAVSHEVR
jgi:hypothetical protein